MTGPSTSPEAAARRLDELISGKAEEMRIEEHEPPTEGHNPGCNCETCSDARYGTAFMCWGTA